MNDQDVESKLRTIASSILGQGVMFSWGGGGSAGPTCGLSDAGGLADRNRDYEVVGFDAGSLTQYCYKQAFGVEGVPRTTSEQYRSGRVVDAPRPGDLIFPDDPGGGQFAAVYLGSGEVLAATRSGEPIAIYPSSEWGSAEVIRVIQR